MASLTPTQKATIGKALDYLQKIIDCHDAVDKSKWIITQKDVDEIKRIKAKMKQLNNGDKIDFKSQKFTIVAETDRKGIHLNDKFGNDYTNDYTLPADYNLDDCANGRFHDFWRILEILIHETYHWEHHTGLGAFVGLFQDVAIGVGGLFIERIPGWLGFGGKLKRKYSGREGKAYSYTYFLLSKMGHMLTTIWLENDDCLPCTYEHIKRAAAAQERQKAYEWR
jgi:hypothetical protein